MAEGRIKLSKSQELPRFDFLPLYVEKIISSLNCQNMTAAEFGAYCLLLFNSWIQKYPCYLPNDDETLRKLCRFDHKSWMKSKKIILNNFKKKSNKIYNEVILNIYFKQVNLHNINVNKGLKGAEKRWYSNSQTIAELKPKVCLSDSKEKSIINNKNNYKDTSTSKSISLYLSEDSISILREEFGEDVDIDFYFKNFINPQINNPLKYLQKVMRSENGQLRRIKKLLQKTYPIPEGYTIIAGSFKNCLQCKNPMTRLLNAATNVYLLFCEYCGESVAEQPDYAAIHDAMQEAKGNLKGHK